MNGQGTEVLFPQILDLDGLVFLKNVPMKDQTDRALHLIATREAILGRVPTDDVVKAAQDEWRVRFPDSESREERFYDWQMVMDELVPTSETTLFPIAS